MEFRVIACVMISLLTWCNAEDAVEEVSLRSFESSAGGVYTRWGRGDCPPVTAELVYSGVVGGSHFQNRGGGSNYLCLHNTPVYGATTTKWKNEKRGRVYSAEYEGRFGRYGSLTDHDVPCAVCEAKERATVLMIPGRSSCPMSWTREYDGFLMAEEYRHYRTEFVCVDKHASDKSNTAGDSSAAKMYPVESKCSDRGGLPCGPFRDGAELTCVVCTK